MSPAQRNRTAALLKASGFEDGPALTVQSTDGEIPHGRELSFAWLTGTVMTGLTSVLLMGAALYVSFEGQDTFSTAYEALQLITRGDDAAAEESQVKGDRVRPVAKTKSELEVVEASIRETVDGRALIKKQPFVRVRATLATAATALSEDIPDYDPVAMIDASQPIETNVADNVANPDIYGAEVEGEVQIRTVALPITFAPAPAISDRSASDYVRQTVENLFAEGGGDGDIALAYAPADTGIRDLGVVTDGGLSGIAENVTVIPKNKSADEAGPGRAERVITVNGALKDVLLKNGFDEQTYDMVAATLKNVLPIDNVREGAKLRILMGPARNEPRLIPHRLSVYLPDQRTNGVRHAATMS